jgi:hypothetical protein
MKNTHVFKATTMPMVMSPSELDGTSPTTPVLPKDN